MATQMIPTWETLNRLGKSRLLRTSYIWLLVVPVAARFFSTIDSPVSLTGIGEGLHLRLELPFSWKLFYFSAVAISVAGVIWTVACPRIIQLFSTFRDFESEGRGLDYLRSYAARLHSIEFRENARRIMEDPHVEPTIAREWRSEVFWQIYEHENVKNPFWRVACLALYSAGLAMIVLVLVQNFIYVVRSVIHI